MNHAEWYRPIFDFIAGVGLPIVEDALPQATFLPGIAIRAGGLVVDPERLAWPGDLLHEAGHPAVLPASSRGSGGDDPDAFDGEFGGELEAMAWAMRPGWNWGCPEKC